jgi:hypothetical protein
MVLRRSIELFSKGGHPPRPDPLDRKLLPGAAALSVRQKEFTLKICEPVFKIGHKEVSFCLVDLYAFVVSFLAHAHESLNLRS